jgi:hypothetical protein
VTTGPRTLLASAEPSGRHPAALATEHPGDLHGIYPTQPGAGRSSCGQLPGLVGSSELSQFVEAVAEGMKVEEDGRVVSHEEANRQLDAAVRGGR